MREQAEVLSLIGDVVTDQASPACTRTSSSANQTAALTAATCWRCTSGPRWEVIVTEAPAHLRKRPDAETGIAVIAL